MSDDVKEALALRTKWNTLICTGNGGPLQRQSFSDEEMEWLLEAAEKLAAVQTALDELEAAYKRREHGGVAEGKCLDSIRAALK